MDDAASRQQATDAIRGPQGVSPTRHGTARMCVVPMDGGFALLVGDTPILRHRADAPALFVGVGRADVDMYRGNYFLSDRLDARVGYGRDLVVAPVIAAGATRWPAYPPAGETWVHLWSGARHAGGATVEVDATIGRPPVFWREGSTHAALFEGIARDYVGAT